MVYTKHYTLYSVQVIKSYGLALEAGVGDNIAIFGEGESAPDSVHFKVQFTVYYV